jgi:hypothetical protein
MTFKYFAYGSNMLTERLKDRCKSAQAIGIGVLPGYMLRFWKKSRDGSAKCTIVPSDGQEVLGVLFEIAASEEPQLDNAEGLGHGYGKLDDVRVALVSGADIRAKTYIGEDLDESLQSYDWYRALVIAGAMQHGLAQEWITALESTACIADQDPRRIQSALQLLMQAGYEKLLAEPAPA